MLRTVCLYTVYLYIFSARLVAVYILFIFLLQCPLCRSWYSWCNRPIAQLLFVVPLVTGTLGFGLGREAEVICGVRKADNTFERMTYTFGPGDMGWEKEVSSSTIRGEYFFS